MGEEGQLGGGVSFMRALILMNRISALIKETLENSLVPPPSFCCVWTQRENGLL